MSPVFILSRLCLKRRFQFFGISVPPEVRYLTTFLTASSSMTLRRPTRSALSAGTFTVMSLWRILIVRYSRFSPSTSRDSFLTTVPAPWWGYTTLSPTLYNAEPPLLVRFSRMRPAGARTAGGLGQYSENRWKQPLFRKSPAQRDNYATTAGTGRPGCAPGGGGGPPGSRVRGRCRRPRPTRAPAARRARSPRDRPCSRRRA